MARFLYPCPHCDHQVELQTAQAGQDIECPSCQQKLEAPKLGVMRQLPIVGGDAPKSKSGNSGLKRFLFAGGLALAVLLGASGWAIYQYGSRMIIDVNWDEAIGMMEADHENLTGSELLIEFNKMDVSRGIGEWEEQELTKNRTQGIYLRYFSFALMGGAGIGLLMILASFMVKGGR